MTTRSLSYTTRRTTPPGLPSEREVLGHAAHENFRVASRILPKAARSHLMAYYAFARLVDQIGDAWGGDRLPPLVWLERGPAAAAAAPSRADGPPRGGRAPASARALGAAAGALPDPIEATRRDQVVHSYQTFDDLLGY